MKNLELIQSRIKKLIKVYRYSLAELCSSLHVSRWTLSRALNDNNKKRLTYLKDVLSLLNVKIEEIYKEDFGTVLDEHNAVYENTVNTFYKKCKDKNLKDVEIANLLGISHFKLANFKRYECLVNINKINNLILELEMY